MDGYAYEGLWMFLDVDECLWKVVDIYDVYQCLWLFVDVYRGAVGVSNGYNMIYLL